MGGEEHCSQEEEDVRQREEGERGEQAEFKGEKLYFERWEEDSAPFSSQIRAENSLKFLSTRNNKWSVCITQELFFCRRTAKKTLVSIKQSLANKKPVTRNVRNDSSGPKRVEE